jgi:hypothetical protein
VFGSEEDVPTAFDSVLLVLLREIGSPIVVICDGVRSLLDVKLYVIHRELTVLRRHASSKPEWLTPYIHGFPLCFLHSYVAIISIHGV